MVGLWLRDSFTGHLPRYRSRSKHIESGSTGKRPNCNLRSKRGHIKIAFSNNKLNKTEKNAEKETQDIHNFEIMQEKPTTEREDSDFIIRAKGREKSINENNTETENTKAPSKFRLTSTH